jgi:glycosyltransferase involved in cell wall biosynthesis
MLQHASVVPGAYGATPAENADPGVRLSVIIPCHNVELYLDDCVRSLLLNLDDSYEFIFIDDASTDRTPELLEQTVARLPGARVLTHRVNRGLAAARNTGLDAARGTYLAFLDSDDLVAPGYFDTLVRTSTELDVDFLRTDHIRFSGNRRMVDRIQFGPRRRPAQPRSGVLPIDRNSSVDYPFAWAGAFHRRIAERGLVHFNPQLRTCEDRPWIWRLHLYAESMAAADLLGVLYRRDIKGSLSQVTDDRQFDFIPAFEQIIADVTADREADRFLPKAIRSYCAIMCHQLARLHQYERHLAKDLQHRCEQAVGRLPQSELRTAVADLNPERRHQMNRLIKAAA